LSGSAGTHVNLKGGKIFMRLWQKGMIFLARNKNIKNFMQSRRTMSALTARFVGGKDVLAAVEKSRYLKSQKRNTSLFYLGEYVEDISAVNQSVSEIKKIIKRLAYNGQCIHISIDPTQIGYQIDEKICRTNAFEIAEEYKRAIKDTGGDSKNLLMLDMEDSSVTDATIKLYEALREASVPAAITLQAYLFRTETDMKKIVKEGGAVRLVKGALAENKKVAFTNRSATDRNYLKLAELMLSEKVKNKGFYPIFATHDDKIINKIIEIAEDNGWKKEEYEFEMLYGVRIDLQDKLIKNGEQLRLYLPFGTDWWPYAIRRIGESFKNASFLLRTLLAS
jgi:proline dehydrogenase